MTPPKSRIGEATWIGLGLSSLLVACQFVGTQQSSTPVPPTPTPVVTIAEVATPAPSIVLTPTPTASLSAADAVDVQLHQQADRYLKNWAAAVGNAPPDAVVFVGELTRGGGWHGPNADNAKAAFMSGMIDAAVALPTDTPAPREVSWADGTTQTVSLLSASEALAEMISQAGGGSCGGCQAVKVTGAKLVTGEADTSRGPATVPLWQFEFAPDDRPSTPITHLAVRDRVVPPAMPDWNPYGGNPVGDRIDAIYGTSSEVQLTAVFVGAPLRGDSWCGADYTGEAVESELALVVIIHGTHHPPSDSSPGGCFAVGATRTAVVNLLSPLGSRTVLDVQFGQPVGLRSGDPPADAIASP